MLPTTTHQWSVQGQNGFDSLKLQKNVKIPPLGDHDVLVQFKYASLNYRDLIIPKGHYPFPQKDGVVPGSDGSGVVLATGPRVKEFEQGDKVLTLFNQSHQSGAVTQADQQTGLGGALDGVLRHYGVLEETGLVKMPSNLSFAQGATLSCAALTAWNALYGIGGYKSLKAGDWVLTQGTGGVSIFALQFAKAAGAQVISTTSSPSKAEKLKSLGATHVINYHDVPQWGSTAKRLSTDSLGVGHVIEVGGPNTIAESLQATKPEGVIDIIGFLGGAKGKQSNEPGFLDCLTNIVTVRGIFVGSRAQFEDMNRAIEANDIKPVVDDKVFAFDQLKEAYECMWDQRHFGKLVIKICDD